MKDHAADNLFSLTSSTTINIRIQNIFIAFIKPDVSRDLPDKCIPSFRKSSPVICSCHHAAGTCTAFQGKLKCCTVRLLLTGGTFQFSKIFHALIHQLRNLIPHMIFFGQLPPRSDHLTDRQRFLIPVQDHFFFIIPVDRLILSSLFIFLREPDISLIFQSDFINLSGNGSWHDLIHDLQKFFPVIRINAASHRFFLLLALFTICHFPVLIIFIRHRI